MANHSEHFSLEKVKALRAYFEQSRKSAKGKPDFGDLDTTVRLCDQLIAVMQPRKAAATSAAEDQH